MANKKENKDIKAIEAINTYRVLGLLEESIQINKSLIGKRSRKTSKEFVGSASEILSLIIRVILGL